MSAVHPPPNLSATSSDTSAFHEGIGIPSTFVRSEMIRLLQHEQEKAVALLETSPLLSYLFLSYVIPAKATPDSSISDHNEELSALRLRSEKLESELAEAQAASTEAQNTVASFREEVQQLRSDLVEARSREAAVLEEKEREKEHLRKDAQMHKSEGDALQKTILNQQLEMARMRQQHTADKNALETRIDELQRRFDELSRRQEEVTTPIPADVSVEHWKLEEITSGRTSKSPEKPPTPTIRPQHVPQPLRPLEPQVVQSAGSPEMTPHNHSNHQIPDQSSSPVRLSKSQKFKAKRIAKKQVQEAREEVAVRTAHTEVIVEAP